MKKPNIGEWLTNNARKLKNDRNRKSFPEVSVESQAACHCGGARNQGKRCAVCDQAFNLADRLYEAYRAKQDADARFQALEAELLKEMAEVYRDYAEQGEFSKTFNVSGDESPGMQVIFTDRFSDLPLEKENALQELLGEKYNKYFFQRRNISVADTSDETLKLILSKLGEENFKKFFKIEMSLGCQGDMDRGQWDLPPEVRLILRQYKASLRPRKSEE